jgi:hypothetical protein
MMIEKCHRCVGSQACENQVVNECLPVDVFGNISEKSVMVATVGLNPALNEFYERDYKTPKSRDQRLAMLSDYKLNSRADLHEADLKDAKKRREEYFVNTAREWHSYFERFESLISRIEPRWSFVSGRVVHIDLVACSTYVRWSELSENCKTNLLSNCRGHFLETLSNLPNGTLLLFDGSSVINEMRNLGATFDREGDYLQQNRGYIGNLKLGEKLFPFRGWSKPVGKLSLIWRYDLAEWLCRTFNPPLPFLPVSK